MKGRRALLSVSDKTGIVDLARCLVGLGVELLASGGTARALQEAGLAVVPVSQVTGSPEILGGRVKTLHPAVHGGILSRRTAGDRSQLERLGWGEIEFVVVNLYPFERTIRSGITLETAIEDIDIGGVALLRAAAKNYQHVTVLCSPEDYAEVIAELEANGSVGLEAQRRLAAKVFARTASYDAAISRYLAPADQPLPDRLVLGLQRAANLRYGENPHQRAALYMQQGEAGPLCGRQLQGKPLSYNNLLDLDAAWWAVQSFDRPTIVIVKHLSPCGIASADTLAEAFKGALAADPLSAFGSVIAANRSFGLKAAKALGELFVEAIAAPGFPEQALAALSSRSACRLLEIAESRSRSTATELRSVAGGFLVQERDAGDEAEWRVVSKREAAEAEMSSLRFAWQAVAHVKSNAILLAVEQQAVGIGGGQPSRLDAVRQALNKAGDRAKGSVLASDAFFPFPDGLEEAARAGVTAAVQPGGSIRDEQVIAAADDCGMAMYLTGIRHFRH